MKASTFVPFALAMLLGVTAAHSAAYPGQCRSHECARIEYAGCEDGELEQGQQALEEPDQRQQQLEQPDPGLIDGPSADPRQYDNEEPDARQQDLERPRYEYDF